LHPLGRGSTFIKRRQFFAYPCYPGLTLFIAPTQTCLRAVSCGIEEFGVPLFCTLTFAGSADDIVKAGKALSRFQLWLRSFNGGAESVFVPEISPRGRIHYHGLIFGLPLSWGDKRGGKKLFSRGWERKTRVFAYHWGEGFVDLRQTDGSPRLGSYLAKYILKHADNPLFAGVRLVRLSRGMPKHWEARGEAAFLASENLVRKLPSRQFSALTPYLGYLQKLWYEV